MKILMSLKKLNSSAFMNHNHMHIVNILYQYSMRVLISIEFDHLVCRIKHASSRDRRMAGHPSCALLHNLRNILIYAYYFCMYS